MNGNECSLAYNRYSLLSLCPYMVYLYILFLSLFFPSVSVT